jgi:hypothetical protein
MIRCQGEETIARSGRDPQDWPDVEAARREDGRVDVSWLKWNCQNGQQLWREGKGAAALQGSR